MDWITETIAIGNYLDAEDAELRCYTGIRSMICLNGKLRGVRPEALELDALDNYDLKDGPGITLNFFAALSKRSVVSQNATRSYWFNVMQDAAAL